jgi:RNA polymerase sigma-70 factor (ECF subfamily)
VSGRDDLYESAAQEYGAALSRLARAYEADPEKRRDLLQDIHLQLWRSFESFDSRCSLRTWIYRVAHHTATSHVIKERRRYTALVSVEALESMPDPRPAEDDLHRRDALERLAALIRQLKPLDRQIIVSYLEGLDAATTAEITGLSPANVAMKVHRIKNLLARRFQAPGVPHHGE